MRYNFFYKTVGSAAARGQYRVQCQYQRNRNRHCNNSAITTLRDHSSWIFGDRHHIDFRTRRFIVFVLSARFSVSTCTSVSHPRRSQIFVQIFLNICIYYNTRDFWRLSYFGRSVIILTTHTTRHNNIPADT